MRRFVFGLALCACQATAAIYRCPSDQGVPLYTDRPCDGGIEQASTATSIIEAAPLTEAEQSLLERMQRPPPRVRVRPAPGGSRGARDAAGCDAARAALAEIRQTRRRGYRLRDSEALDRRESALREQASKVCAD